MRLPQSTRLARANTLLTCATFVVNVVGFSTPYWLKKSFLFPLNRGGVVDLPVDAMLGLFTACKTEHYNNGNSNKDCSSEGAADWQVISAVLAIAGLVFALLATILSVLGVVRERFAGKVSAKIFLTLLHLLACSFYVGPLLMFAINKRIQVKPKLSPFAVDFDLGYSYFLTAASTSMFALLVLLDILDLIWSSRQEEKQKEDRASLAKYRSSFN
ncbi:hypothetical protein BsWGS_10680 [Bradybaena similaris]